MPSAVALRHQDQRATTVNRTARAVLERWHQVDPTAVSRSWAFLLSEVVALVRAGQLTAARQTESYMRELLGTHPGHRPGCIRSLRARRAPA